MAEELFTFVLRPEVDATNNLSERELRGPAQDRKAGRTNKTASGDRSSNHPRSLCNFDQLRSRSARRCAPPPRFETPPSVENENRN